MTVAGVAPNDSDQVLRERALTRLKKKRDLQTHLLIYVLVNANVVLIWFMTGPHGFFWPVFFIAFWSIGVAMNVWDVYRTEEFSEEAIQHEMNKLES